MENIALSLEYLAPTALKPHPRNYVSHPDDQLEHLMASIKAHGVYRNVIIANDDTILAGHGVVQAAVKMGLLKIPVRRLDLDPNDPAALKVLVGDNEMRHLIEIDDRALSEMLKEIQTEDVNSLLGTGYNEASLAAFLLATRMKSEIADIDEAAEWANAGMPDHEDGERLCRLVVNFPTIEDRKAFCEQLALRITKQSDNQMVWSARWPDQEVRDISAVRFQ